MGVLQAFDVTDFDVSTSAYAANDAIGLAGPYRIQNVTRYWNSGWIRQINMYVKEAVTSGVSVLFFDRLPTGGTYTDNGALAISAADHSALIDIVPIVTADYLTSTGVQRIATVQPNLPFKVLLRDLYFLVRADQTPTYAAAGNVDWKFIIERD